MKAEIFVNISVTLQNIFNFGENEFYKLAKDDEDLYLYGKNAFVSFENSQPRFVIKKILAGRNVKTKITKIFEKNQKS